MSEHSLDYARHLDETDPIQGLRQTFSMPQGSEGQDCTYLVGHSLGLQPRGVAQVMQAELERWSRLGVRGHFEGEPGWMRWAEAPGQTMAKLVGAESSEVTIMNTLSVNLHALLATFYHPTPERFKILIEQSAFPSDRYVIESQLEFHGYNPIDAIVECPSVDGLITPESLEKCLEEEGDRIALVFLGGVNYLTGQWLDLKAVSDLAKQHECSVGFDLAHAVGNVPLDLKSIDCDFAAWCCYKYLNGGPGSLGAIYVNSKHHDRLPALRGWWGHDIDSRFEMSGIYQPAAGAERFHLSTVPLFSLIPIGVSMEIFASISFDQLWTKSQRLTSFMDSLLRDISVDQLEVWTPSGDGQRGAQISLRVFGHSSDIRDEFRSKSIMVDWREPGVIRAAPVPLYNSFEDVWRFVHVLESILSR